jgi:hypothetical protein
MKLICTPVSTWPKLSWVARATPGDQTIHVYHGPMVETGDGWCVEAVWTGDFTRGRFDQTDIVLGSGVRCIGDKAVFVSPSTGVDRLWHCRHKGDLYVSNSMPGLLAATGLSLREDLSSDSYRADLHSVEDLGIARYKRALPTDGGDLNVLYFDNLEYDGASVAERAKPVTAPHFACCKGYLDYLVRTAREIGANLACPARRTRIVPLSGISSGYDSPAVSAIARYAGCTQTATIRNSASFWRGSDSGEAIAKQLGMECRGYDLDPRSYRDETAVWAAAGVAGGLNLTLFDYPQPLCLFFNGSYGDKVWDRRRHDLSEPVGDRDSFLCEFRLSQGVFHCVVPWWGIARAGEINALGAREEMAPWTLNTSYDRPVARRILEEAGVDRNAFGIRKKNASSNAAFLWPYSAQCQESFRRFLKDRGLSCPSRFSVRWIRRLAQAENLFYLNVLAALGIRKRLRPWRSIAGSRLLVHWAVDELKKTYRQALPPELAQGQA